MMIERFTEDDIASSLRSFAAGEMPAIDAALLVRLLPPFNGIDDSAPSPASIEYIGLQWRFSHRSCDVLGGAW